MRTIFFLLIPLFISTSFAVEGKVQYKGEINIKILNMRSEPTTRSSIITQIKMGSSFDIISEKKSWYKVKLKDGTTGFLFKKYVKKYEVAVKEVPEKILSFKDVVILKTGQVITGKIKMETPRIVILSKDGQENNFKRHLVKKIIYVHSPDVKKVKMIEEREYMKYENYPESNDKTVVHRVGIMPVAVIGLTKDEGQAITNRFRNELHTINKFSIMEQEKMQAILEENEFKSSDVCNEIECFVDIGNMIGVNRMIIGQVTKIGSVISFAVRVVDVSTGKIIRIALEDTELPFDKFLKKILPKVARNITGKASLSKRVFDIKKDGKRFPIAVLKLDDNGITASEAEGFTDRLRTELFNTNQFDVMERDKMKNILDEQEFQKSDLCDDASCLVEIGQLVGVKYMVGGAITKIGKTYTISSRLIDVESGKIMRAATEDTDAKLEHILKYSMSDIARGLAGLKIYSPNPPRNYSIGAAATMMGIGFVFSYMASQSYNSYRDEQFDTEQVAKYRSQYQVQYAGSIISYSMAGIGAASALYFHLKKKSKLKLINSLVIAPQIGKKGIVIAKNF